MTGIRLVDAHAVAVHLGITPSRLSELRADGRIQLPAHRVRLGRRGRPLLWFDLERAEEQYRAYLDTLVSATIT